MADTMVVRWREFGVAVVLKTFRRGALLIACAIGSYCIAPHVFAPQAQARSGGQLPLGATIQSAERGNAKAQALLGFMYEHGHNVAQNYVRAAYWYRCAAEQGQPTAQFLLGLLYDKGHGVERSETLAYMWLSLAASHAPPEKREYFLRIRDAVATKLNDDKIADAQWLAAQFVPIHGRR